MEHIRITYSVFNSINSAGHGNAAIKDSMIRDITRLIENEDSKDKRKELEHLRQLAQNIYVWLMEIN